MFFKNIMTRILFFIHTQIIQFPLLYGIHPEDGSFLTENIAVINSIQSVQNNKLDVLRQ
jgi:hypothetical protein